MASSSHWPLRAQKHLYLARTPNRPHRTHPQKASTYVRQTFLTVRSTRIIIVPVEIAHNRCVVVRINCTSSSTFSVCARIRALIYQIWRVEVGKEQLFGSCLRASVARVRRKKKGNHPWPCNGVTACVSDALAKLAMYPSVRTIFYGKVCSIILQVRWGLTFVTVAAVTGSQLGPVNFIKENVAGCFKQALTVVTCDWLELDHVSVFFDLVILPFVCEWLRALPVYMPFPL